MNKRLNQPLGGNEMPRFGGIASMLRLPVVDNDAGLAELDAAFIGIPLLEQQSSFMTFMFMPRLQLLFSAWYFSLKPIL